MFAIAFMGVIMHELPKQQLQALSAAIKTAAGVNSIVVCNANGVFSSAPRLATQVELLFDSGIELVFLGEQAIARSSGRNEIEKDDLPILRPLNLHPEIPGTGAKLIEIGEDKIWMLSVADQSYKTPVGVAHECLDEFFGNKKDNFPVLISVNGKDLDYKKALSWKYSNLGFSVAVIGTGLNFRSGDALVDGNGNLFLADIGAVAAKNAIAGVSPENWWKKHVQHVPVPMLPDNSPVNADYSLFFYEKGRITKVCRDVVRL
ncbi:MAG: 2,3-cyclic-nucleotide 2-phosphodiesterase [Clostridiales bacterium]|jgi:calcineurin-like phosphoesterase|nr:2,3-cyclic-nucleotide 2-phosphodiesterase [Clostridiales bacterium]MDN5283378.1 2,3-cyclic-nucleotide 2-phosphodiesterase [Candidatus Ozemobacter sp.]